MTETELAGKLRRLIKANGPMSVAEWMTHCLGDPEHGYYGTRDPLGAAGDFITAPEISQMFGEIVGAWLVTVWRSVGAPSPVALVELGPGRGTLMADILRVARHDADFSCALDVHFIETSPALRRAQERTLARSGRTPRFHDTIAGLPPGPWLIVANEFFDALPVRQFVRRGGEWRERVVGLDELGRFAFGLGPGAVRDADVETAPADEGDVLEVSPAAVALVSRLAERIAADGGALIAIDYGHEGGLGDTLQAVRAHAHADPLDLPGEADLTAHVDFSALARAARAAGAFVHGPMAQSDFLLRLGLLERAGRLGAEKDEAARDTIRAAVERLAGPREMGRLFKALAVTPPGYVPPPF